MDGVQVELPAQPPVIALFDLLQLLQIRVEVRLRFPRGAIDALEHLVLLIPAPVGAGDRGELEGVGLQGARVRHVGTAAEIGERILRIGGDLLALGQLLDELQLVRLVLEELSRLRPAHRGALEGVVAGHDGAHPLLHPRQVLGAQGPGKLEVVVEAFLDCRTDGELRAGENLEDRLCHHVGEGMADLQEPVLFHFVHVVPPNDKAPHGCFVLCAISRQTVVLPRTKSRSGPSAVPP